MGNIRVFEKNKFDESQTTATITVTDAVATDTGEDFLPYLRNRSNFNGWTTQASTDAANTQLDIDLGSPYTLSMLGLTLMNFAAYTLQYYNGAAYADFPGGPVNIAGNTKATKFHFFNETSIQLLRLIITGCIVANDDKRLTQIICTREIGVFKAQPKISRMENDVDMRVQDAMSGRKFVPKKTGGKIIEWDFPPSMDREDMDLVDDIYGSNEGRLISHTGCDDSSLLLKPTGFKNEDLFLLTPVDNRNTAFHEGRFRNGLSSKIRLAEAM